jgi:hypothetical protein
MFVLLGFYTYRLITTLPSDLSTHWFHLVNDLVHINIALYIHGYYPSYDVAEFNK